jgi:hypothetical protein
MNDKVKDDIKIAQVENKLDNIPPVEVWKLQKGRAGLEINAKVGGWETVEYFASEALLEPGDIERMYWMSSWEDSEIMNVAGFEEITFESIAVAGSPSRYYPTVATGWVDPDNRDIIYISNEEFEQKFC